jgi:hypothetical protein
MWTNRGAGADTGSLSGVGAASNRGHGLDFDIDASRLRIWLNDGRTPTFSFQHSRISSA